jgi:hypothetical protein
MLQGRPAGAPPWNEAFAGSRGRLRPLLALGRKSRLRDSFARYPEYKRRARRVHATPARDPQQTFALLCNNDLT